MKVFAFAASALLASTLAAAAQPLLTPAELAVAQQSSTAPVIIDKTGFERDIYVFAHDHSFLYGLSAVALALSMGAIAGALGRRRSA